MALCGSFEWLCSLDLSLLAKFSKTLSFIFDKKYCYVTLTLIAIQVSIVYLLNKT